MPPGTDGSAVRRALVTGASSGIGAAFAGALSAQGYELILVGRDRERLAAVAGGLPGPARVVVADLTREPDLAAVEALLADADAPVDLLVNNAAAGWHGPFVEHDPDLLGATVALNVTAAVRLTRAALPSMLARGRGGLINVSSVAGSSPAPNMATYAATKAFVNSWTASLRAETRGTDVTVTAVQPGYVRSAFHARSGEDLDHLPDTEWIPAETVAARALEAHARGRAVVVVLPDLSPVERAKRRVRAWLILRAPWVRDVTRAVRSRVRSG